MVELVEAKMVVYGKSCFKAYHRRAGSGNCFRFSGCDCKSKLAPYKIDSMNVTLQSSNYNAAQVFPEEYKGFELFLSAGIFFLGQGTRLKAAIARAALLTATATAVLQGEVEIIKQYAKWDTIRQPAKT